MITHITTIRATVPTQPAMRRTGRASWWRMVSLSADGVSWVTWAGGIGADGARCGCTGCGRTGWGKAGWGRAGAGGAAVPRVARGAVAAPGCTRVPQWLVGAGAVATAPCAGDGTEIDSEVDRDGVDPPAGVGIDE